MPKRTAANDTPSTNKLIKTENHTPEDFSNSVKKRLAGSTRTGQACDRCKVRKIRCDGKPGGCSPCAQNNTPCKTTDRITGRATTRGHTELLETQNDSLRAHVLQLENQLRSLGVEVKPFVHNDHSTPPDHSQSTTSWPPSGTANSTQLWAGDQLTTNDSQALSYDGKSLRASSTPNEPDEPAFRSALPAFKDGCIGDNYLGISGGDSILSPIKGLSLSVFGIEFNLSDFIADDPNESSSPLSYEQFLRVIYNRADSVEKVPWPNYDEVEQFATWYFGGVHPYCPVLWKPSFMQLIWRVYNEPGFQPSPAQTVMIHMVLAIMKFQIAARNSVTHFFNESHKHYMYSLTFFSDLIMSHTLDDVQALALVCVYLRNAPKPGAAWMVTTQVFDMAIELGLHRSPRAWGEAHSPLDEKDSELRRRLFWSLFSILVGLSGKLGRPMPLRLEDIDVELPKPINDSGQGLEMNGFHDCSFQIGLQCAPVAVLWAEMYSSIYSLKQRPQDYEKNVRKLEQDVKKWRDQAPPELSLDSNPDHEDAVFVRYMQYFEQELQLLIHHPSLCRNASPDFLSHNLDACLAASKSMLHTVDGLRKLKGIDLTWINVMTYLAAIFTTLYIHSQRKDQMNSIDLIGLRNDMDLWLDIMKEVGIYFGTGHRLHTALQKIIEQSLEGIGGHIVKKTATAAVAQAAPLNTPPHPSVPANTNGYVPSSSYVAGYGDAPSIPNGIEDAKPAAYMSGGDGSVVASSSNGFPSSQYQYQDTPNSAYQPPVSTGFDNPSYPASLPDGSNMSAEQAAQAAAAAAAAASVAYVTQPSPYQTHTAMPVPNHNLAWREWSQQTVMSNLPPAAYIPTPTATTPTQQHTRISSANALMALGGAAAVGNVGQATGPHTLKGQEWPQLMFDYRQNGEP